MRGKEGEREREHKGAAALSLCSLSSYLSRTCCAYWFVIDDCLYVCVDCVCVCLVVAFPHFSLTFTVINWRLGFPTATTTTNLTFSKIKFSDNTLTANAGICVCVRIIYFFSCCRHCCCYCCFRPLILVGWFQFRPWLIHNTWKIIRDKATPTVPCPPIQNHIELKKINAIRIETLKWHRVIWEISTRITLETYWTIMIIIIIMIQGLLGLIMIIIIPILENSSLSFTETLQIPL